MAESVDRLLVSEVARRAGVNVQTVLYYERRGIIPTANRRPSGYREFDPQTVEMIGFVQRAQELGFTLTEITELLALRSSEGAKCNDVRKRAVEKLNLIEEKIEQLDAMGEALQRLIQSCSGRGPARDCPIIEAIQQEGGRIPQMKTLVRRKR